MRRGIAVVLLALFAFNAYAALGILSRWPFAQKHVPFTVLVTLFAVLIELMGPVGDRLIFPKLRAAHPRSKSLPFFLNAVDWLSYLALGLLSCLFLYVLLADVLTLIRAFLALHNDAASSLAGSDRLFNARLLLALGAGTALTIAIGVTQALADPKIREVDIPLKGLPAAFDGFRIVQISDLHIGPILRRTFAARVVALANSLKPDLLALTGDFVDGSVRDLKYEVAPLAELAAPYGKFFITGNHEYYWNAEDWTKEFRRIGLSVLLNEFVLITRDGASFLLAGVTDYSSPDTSPEKAVRGAPEDLVRILLAHQPASFKAAHASGFHLQISGHTHGGQYFPFSLIVRFFQRYLKGLNRFKDMWIYVSTGTGFWGPPLRAGVPSEITVLTLREA